MNAEIQIRGTEPRAMAGARRVRRIAVFAAVALLSSAGIGCLGAGATEDELQSSDRQPREERIAELRRAIDRDHATLEDRITRPPAEGGAPLHDDPEIRAIAARLTEQVRTLERLEAAAEAAR